MSVSSVGAFGFGDASQILSRMLSRLDSNQPAASNTNASDFSNATSTVSQPSGSDASNSLTGTAQSQLSDQIVAVLVQVQQQSQGLTSQPAGAIVPQASEAGGSSPVQQLFTAIDANGDGSISQSEMENYIEAQGGTQAQGDTLFSSLSQNGASGISESQLAGDASQAPHMHHGHHHHMQGADSQNPSTDLASQLFEALDSNQDGTLSASELPFAANPVGSATGVTAQGDGASNLLSEIDSNGDGSVSNGEFTSFVASLEQQIESDTASMGDLISRAAHAYGAAANGSTAVNQTQLNII